MVLPLLTHCQNELIDNAAKTYKHNQDIRNIHLKELCNSFDNQSSFHLDKTFYMSVGRAAQVLFVAMAVITHDNAEIFKPLMENLSRSNAGFEVCNQLFTPYQQSKAPAIESAQLVEQKKLETLTQSDTTETSKADRLQQTIQSAKDVYAQQLLKASSN